MAELDSTERIRKGKHSHKAPHHHPLGDKPVAPLVGKNREQVDAAKNPTRIMANVKPLIVASLV